MTEPEKMKVAELRAALQERGLDTKGTKPILVSRLQEAIREEEEKKEPTPEPEPEANTVEEEAHDLRGAIKGHRVQSWPDES